MQYIIAKVLFKIRGYYYNNFNIYKTIIIYYYLIVRYTIYDQHTRPRVLHAQDNRDHRI